VNTDSVRSALESTVAISQFNRGLAGKIFEDVKHSGAKVVMKNNAPECVLVAPEEYIKIMDELEDTRLLNLAAERMANFDPAFVVSQSEVDEVFGFDPEKLEDLEEIEFE